MARRRSRRDAKPVSGLGPKQEALAYRAAVLHYELGESNAAVAEKLEISESYASKLIGHAVASGWVQTRVQAPRQFRLEAELTQRLAELGISVEVHAADPRGLSLATARTLRAVLLRKYAAAQASDPVPVIGVDSGSALVDAALHVEPIPPDLPQPVVVPLSIPPNPTELGSHALAVAVLLGAHLSGRGPGRVAHWGGAHLWRVPDGVSGVLDHPEFKSSLLRLGWSDLAIVVARPRRVDLDWIRSRSPIRFSEVVCPRNVCCSLAGRFIGYDGRLIPAFDSLDTFELAVPDDELRRSSRFAGQDRTERIVVVDRFGEGALAAVRGNYCTHLICDEQTAEEFIEKWDEGVGTQAAKEGA